MEKIKSTSLLKFNSSHTEHLGSYQKIKNYNFNDVALIKKFLESTDFPNGVIIDYEDLNRFIVEGEFMVSIEFEDENLNDWKYLFDAFNVYFSNNQSEYTKDIKLTAIWQKIMKSTYPDSYYTSDLRLLIEEERKQKIIDINNYYDKQIESL